MVIRADAEDDIRGAVSFAAEHGLKLVIAGGLEAWRCADAAQGEGRGGAGQRATGCRRASPIPTTRAYANAAALHRAGVRFAIVSDDASRVAQPALRGGHGARLRPARGRGAARDHALAGRDLRRRRPHGLDRGRQGRQPVPGHRRHHGPPHAGDARLHRRRRRSRWRPATRGSTSSSRTGRERRGREAAPRGRAARRGGPRLRARPGARGGPALPGGLPARGVPAPAGTRCFDRIGAEAVAVVQGVPLTNGYQLPRQTNSIYYLSGIETPHAYLRLDGRDRRVTLYLPPRNERLERSEGKVLSAADAELVKRLAGADEVLSTEAMGASWPLGEAHAGGDLRRERAGRGLRPEPPRAAGRRRRDRQRLLGRPAVARAALRRAAARTPPARRDQGPDPDPRRAARDQEPARDRPRPPRLAARGARRAGGDPQHRAGSLRVPARRRLPLRVPAQRRAPRRLPLDHRERHRQHLERALLPEHEEARGRRPGADGLRARLSLLRERHRAHVAGRRALPARSSASCCSSCSSTGTPS